MGTLNVASSLNTSGLFASKSNTNTASMAASREESQKAASKSTAELEDEIEILKMQKKDLRQLVQERTRDLDQMKKLDAEHQSLRDRWKSTEEKALKDVVSMSSHSEELGKELADLKRQNAALQSKQTNNDLIKNELENKVAAMVEAEGKSKKAMERRQKEKQMLVAEVLKVRAEKEELTAQFKAETDRLNSNNVHNAEQLAEHFEIELANKEREHAVQCRAMEERYDELAAVHGHYRQNVRDKVGNIDSTTNAFEAMITNANVGSLSQSECNKILENIIHSIEDMERENALYHRRLQRKRKSQKPIQDLLQYDVDDDDDDELIQNGMNGDHATNGLLGLRVEEEMKESAAAKDKEMDEELLLNLIESRVLKALREKALLQRSSNALMFQLQQLQGEHEKEIKEKNEIIRKQELRAKVTFFKKKQPKS